MQFWRAVLLIVASAFAAFALPMGCMMVEPGSWSWLASSESRPAALQREKNEELERLRRLIWKAPPEDRPAMWAEFEEVREQYNREILRLYKEAGTPMPK